MEPSGKVTWSIAPSIVIGLASVVGDRNTTGAGCPPFARAASPRLRFASFTTPSPSLSPFRTRAPMCVSFRSPFACVRAALPLACTSSRARWGWAGRTDPLASPGVHGRGGVRKRRAGVARAEGVDVPTLPLACAGGGGLDWRGPCGGVGAPSLLLRMRAGCLGLGWCPAPRRAGLCAPSLPM
ncbi:hypothetical protein EDB83DRAFT_2454506, partial [Lactarius deliciosus]